MLVLVDKIILPPFPSRINNFDKIFRDEYNKNIDLQNGNLHKEYYSDDILFSDTARRTWIQPNLKALCDWN